MVCFHLKNVQLILQKVNNKEYWKHSGFPGSGTLIAFKDLNNESPEIVIKKSVEGMLPHNKLGRELIKHLKVYSGDVHPHESQKPKLLEL